MGMFANLDMNKRKGGEGGIYFKGGDGKGGGTGHWYTVEILRNKQGAFNAAQGGNKFFAAEFKILKSDCPTLKVGTPVSFFVKVDKFPDLAYGNMVDYMRAALCAKLAKEEGIILDPKKVAGTEDDPIDSDATCDKFGSENDESIGVVLEVFAFEKKKTKSEGYFTHHRWFVPGSDIDRTEAIAEAKKAAKSGE